MLRRYLHEYGYFVEVSLAWLSAFTSVPQVDPTVDQERPGRSLGYSALMLVLWVGALLGGFAVEQSLTTDQPLLDVAVMLVWGFGVAPVLAVVVMKTLFPGFSKRLQAQRERDHELNRRRVASELRAKKKEKAKQ